MANNSNIEWTDATWNTLYGCSAVSPGCLNCYAAKDSIRWSTANKLFSGLAEITPSGSPRWLQENGQAKIKTAPHRIEIPLGIRKPKKIFVNSMSDTFHEQVSDDFIDKLFAVMALCPQHTFQVLTKRPERMREYFSKLTLRNELIGIEAELMGGLDRHTENLEQRWQFPLPNVWLGVSCENQQTADERIPLLLSTPAAVRWISAEPLLGPIDLNRHYLAIKPDQIINSENMPRGGTHWVVCGGESGINCRPMNIEWARSLRDQCNFSRVPFFMKQFGGHPDKHHDFDSFPPDLNNAGRAWEPKRK